MKYLKYLLISVLTLCASIDGFACWEPWFSPSGYYMYRIYDLNAINYLHVPKHEPDYEENCEQWQKLTSLKISIGDIYRVVYEMPLEELETINERRDSVYNNEFTEWITKRDTAILDFLLLAKTNENVRFQCNSRWYYPTMKTDGAMSLNEIAEKALSVKNKRLRDRYMLQAIRAMFSMGRYDDCLKLWDEEVEKLPEDNLMRRMIKPYIAGAMFHAKRAEEAVVYFAQLGDVESVLYCLGRKGEQLSLLESLELVCEYSPNSAYVTNILQRWVGGMEPDGYVYERYGSTENIETKKERGKLSAFCVKMAENKKVENPAMWYYTAAFLSDLNGNTSRAAYLIDLAEKAKPTKYLAESIAVFRMYIDAKNSVYDSAYEKKLFKQLRWLDGKICNNIDENVREEVITGYRLDSNESFYYWNDMLRRILLIEVCPRMIKAGKTTRALQLANMADNRLLGLVNKKQGYWYENHDYQSKIFSTMAEYRYSKCFNEVDYSNHFFEMIDSIGVDNVIEYVQNVRNPQTEFDRFLNVRGYTGSDYLNDITGTQCLRNMRYKEAVQYLGAVSKAYQYHHNVYIDHDPFSLTFERLKQKSDFRYDFAKEMYRLERTMERTSDPNRKAELMMKYAIGITNSFDMCWSLTQYYRGECYWGQVGEKRYWECDEYTMKAQKRAKELTALACGIVTDDEIAANIHYMMGHYKLVGIRYPNTTKGQLVRGSCDNLRDYFAKASIR